MGKESRFQVFLGLIVPFVHHFGITLSFQDIFHPIVGLSLLGQCFKVLYLMVVMWVKLVSEPTCTSRISDLNRYLQSEPHVYSCYLPGFQREGERENLDSAWVEVVFGPPPESKRDLMETTLRLEFQSGGNAWFGTGCSRQKTRFVQCYANWLNWENVWNFLVNITRNWTLNCTPNFLQRCQTYWDWYKFSAWLHAVYPCGRSLD